jgi:hypothetical protein
MIIVGFTMLHRHGKRNLMFNILFKLAKPILSSNFLGLFALLLLAPSLFFTGCSKDKYDPTKITMRPRIFIEGAAPVPIIDEYDIAGVQVGSFSDILSANEQDRVFGLWLALDRRGSMTLQKETAGNLGKNLNLVVNGNVMGFHPVEKTIVNGFIPFLFTSRLSEEDVMIIYTQLQNSIPHIKLELNRQKE